MPADAVLTDVPAHPGWVEDGAHSGPVVDVSGPHSVIDCAACGFRHVTPLPDGGALESEYRERYYSEAKPSFLAHAAEDQEWAEIAQRDRLELMARILGRRGGRRLLDIGCGPGWFLKTAQGQGWSALGVEPNADAAAHARGLGLEVREAMFDDALAQNVGFFDAVALTNVVEHVADPAGLIRRAASCLRAGGVLMVCAPNDYSDFQKALREGAEFEPWWVAAPHHLNYFGFPSLARLLEREGFGVVDVATSFPMELFLMMGDDYTRDPALGRACHAKRKRFDLLLERTGRAGLRRALYRALGELGIGREAVIFAVKQEPVPA